MKSHMARISQFATSQVGVVFMLLVLAMGVSSLPAHAQSGIWKVDADHSIARLSLGSNPQGAEIGVASVGGTVAFDENDPADPIVSLNIKPDSVLGADYSEISFKSRNSALNSDGNLRIAGDLVLTRVERSVIMDGSEGYYGAQYGEPVVTSVSQEVVLVIPAAQLSAAQSGSMQVSASANISRERFPQLLVALEQGNWPGVVVQDKSCAMPSTVGEDYSGAVCSGTPIETATNSVATGITGGGEGYYGAEPAAVSDGSQATIALNLKLTQIAEAPTATLTAAGTAGN